MLGFCWMAIASSLACRSSSSSSSSSSAAVVPTSCIASLPFGLQDVPRQQHEEQHSSPSASPSPFDPTPMLEPSMTTSGDLPPAGTTTAAAVNDVDVPTTTTSGATATSKEVSTTNDESQKTDPPTPKKQQPKQQRRRSSTGGTARRQNHKGKAYRRIESVNEDIDIFLGRGGGSNNQNGNKRYQQVVSQYTDSYHTSTTNAAKTSVAVAIVNFIQSYGGRFVFYDKDDSCNYEITMEAAVKKVRQRLRENCYAKFGKEK
mmetsp:Transcript_9962/g.28286  ORF Transcript_9962/g.28286 Transcript_9962/m.28286 type:complete len:260 (+) Transcript_9962:3699-4478(+)